MPRNLSLWFLLALILIFGLLLFQIIKPFAVAVFVALVLGVLFRPLHLWLTNQLGGHSRIAAAATASLVIVMVLLPISGTLLMAGTQLMRAGQGAAGWFDNRPAKELGGALEQIEDTALGELVAKTYDQLPANQQQRLRSAVGQLADGMTADAYGKTRGLLSDAFTFMVSLAVMALGMYYFLADRDLFAAEIHRVLPLADDEEDQLADRFERVCRGVVLGTVVAGVFQAGLSGVAYAVLDVPQLWLLIVLTMFASFVPLLGAALVWGPVTLWLFIEGRPTAAIVLALYGSTVISWVDNLVRAHVIGHQARLHPLVALVSVLGALKLMGLWGIFVGPMVAAFFYALVNIAEKRIRREHQFRIEDATNAPEPSWRSDPAHGSSRSNHSTTGSTATPTTAATTVQPR